MSQRIKEAITGVPAKISELPSRIQVFNIFKRIEDMEKKLKVLEDWKDIEAIPNISKNIENILKIDENIRNKIIPTINEARQWANNALLQARGAIDAAEGIIENLKTAGNQLVIDATSIKERAFELKEGLTTETENIVNAFKHFGTQLKDAAEKVKVAAVGVGGELQEAVREIKAPLDPAVTWGKRVASRGKRGDLLGAIIAAAHSLSYLIWRGHGGQNSVLLETVEAFNEISRAFTNLSTTFGQFGGTLKNAPAGLSNNINMSMIKIEHDVDDFVAGFSNLSENLSATIKGDIEELQRLRQQQLLTDEEREAQQAADIKAAEEEEARARAAAEAEEARLRRGRAQEGRRRQVLTQEEARKREQHAKAVADVDKVEHEAELKMRDPKATPKEKQKAAQIRKMSRVQKEELQRSEQIRIAKAKEEERKKQVAAAKKEEADIKKVRAARARQEQARKRQAALKRQRDEQARRKREETAKKKAAEAARKRAAEARVRRLGGMRGR